MPISRSRERSGTHIAARMFWIWIDCDESKRESAIASRESTYAIGTDEFALCRLLPPLLPGPRVPWLPRVVGSVVVNRFIYI